MAITKGAWIGIDLDGTLATYNGWKGSDYVGEPIPEMMDRVKEFIKDGIEVRILTARANDKQSKKAVKKWLQDQGLPKLKVTAKKDFGMIVLYDDKAIGVRKNEGKLWAPEQEKEVVENIKKEKI